MRRPSSYLMHLLLVLPRVLAQAPIWGQCGGTGFTGPTTCATGSVCVFENPFFSNCFPTASSAAKVNQVATTAGGKLYFGSSTNPMALNDTAYAAILSDKNLFGQISPENSMNWNITEPARGIFNFTEGDAIAKFAQGNGQLLRGASCVAFDELPVWVTASNSSSTVLESILRTHCSTVVKCKIPMNYQTFADAIPLSSYAWDVVTDPLNDDGTLRDFVFSQSLGESYIATALKAAHAADPSAKLYINENNIDVAGPKSTALIALVKSLKAAGVPLHGIGIQSHLLIGQVPSQADLIANYEAFTALGVEIALTFLDIGVSLGISNSAWVQQEADYKTVVGACKAVAGCVGVTLGEYTDKYSKFPVSPFGISGYSLPWDKNLVRKLAYDGVIAGFAS
ncbi:beta-1,4-endoxylanase [Mycena filopes]|nr:beta-1,4-endoxylanase [Mycena filopes]